jgi:hypothetical protein
VNRLPGLLHLVSNNGIAGNEEQPCHWLSRSAPFDSFTGLQQLVGKCRLGGNVAMGGHVALNRPVYDAYRSGEENDGVSGRAAAQPLLEADDRVRWNHVFGAYFLVLKIGERRGYR